MRNRRQEYIHSKGFAIAAEESFDGYQSRDYAKLKLGIKQVEDAIIDLGTLRRVNKNYGDKSYILNAIAQGDYATMRDISS